jgi:hypothetical protein
MSIRIAASCGQERHDLRVPRGARISRADMAASSMGVVAMIATDAA